MHRDEPPEPPTLTADLDALQRLLQRRRVLQLAAGAGVAAFLGCKADDAEQPDADGGNPTKGATGADTGAADGCEEIPPETAGPFPGDGSNGPNALALSGIVRSDMRASLTSKTIAEGVPLTMKLKVVDGACAALAGHAIYLWHCDREGNYSMYSPGVEGDSHLRAVQQTDADGVATFVTVFPGCYPGRWPHMHFEVFPSLAAAGSHANQTKCSQLAFPKTACDAAYAEPGYESSVVALARLTLATDGVFVDGVAQQLVTMEGTADDGFTAMLTLAV